MAPAVKGTAGSVSNAAVQLNQGPLARQKMKARAHRLNVVGDFFVEQDCCTHCGVPEAEAPALFGRHDESCYVKKQPTSAEEISGMLRVLAAQDIGCVRYKGSDPVLLNRIRSIDDGAHIVGSETEPIYGELAAPMAPSRESRWRRPVLWLAGSIAVGIIACVLVVAVVDSEARADRIAGLIGQLSGIVGIAGAGWIARRHGGSR